MSEIHHPKHYNDHPSGVEAILICEHLPFNLGSAIKYLFRVGKKTGEENKDPKKAAWYLRREAERLREEVRKHDYDNIIYNFDLLNPGLVADVIAHEPPGTCLSHILHRVYNMRMGDLENSGDHARRGLAVLFDTLAAELDPKPEP